MSSFATQSERQSAIAAIARGELTQARVIFDELEHLENRLEKVEKGSQGPVQVSSSVSDELKSVLSIVPPADYAKAADIREVVVELVETVNQILNVLKNKG